MRARDITTLVLNYRRGGDGSKKRRRELYIGKRIFSLIFKHNKREKVVTAQQHSMFCGLCSMNF